MHVSGFHEPGRLRKYDASNGTDSLEVPRSGLRGKPQRFPWVLANIIAGEESKKDRAITWNRAGDAFRIISPEKMEKDVLPLTFKQTKLSSFHRQLNLYGFKKTRSYYAHKHFTRRGNELYLVRRLSPKAGSRLAPIVPSINKEHPQGLRPLPLKEKKRSSCIPVPLPPLMGNELPQSVSHSLAEEFAPLASLNCFVDMHLAVPPGQGILNERSNSSSNISSMLSSLGHASTPAPQLLHAAPIAQGDIVGGAQCLDPFRHPLVGDYTEHTTRCGPFSPAHGMCNAWIPQDQIFPKAFADPVLYEIPEMGDILDGQLACMLSAELSDLLAHQSPSLVTSCQQLVTQIC
ncbi:unnamed protein product [Chrysoparadoxa australica]